MTFFDSLKKWFYTKNSSAASSNARVPLLDASGNPKGSDTMTNLASVLGGLYTIKGLIQNVDLNDIKTNGFYRTYHNITNLPSGIDYSEGFLYVFKSIDDGNFSTLTQIFVSSSGHEFYERVFWYGSWDSWHKIALDFPQFYKNYSTLASLASALGGVRSVTIQAGGDIIISKRAGGSAILALSESMLEGIAFLGRVAYTMASITNLVTTDRTVGWGISSEERLVLYYDSSFNLHMKYNGSRSQLQIEVLTLE